VARLQELSAHGLAPDSDGEIGSAESTPGLVPGSGEEERLGLID
jgi:hypothetical protein